MLKVLIWFCFLFPTSFYGQIEEVRRITEQLCSPEFHGRGYVNKGDSLAAEFLVSEFRKINVDSYKGNYFQKFDHSVNTFPGKMEIRLGNRKLIPGKEFSVDPSSKSIRTKMYPEEIPSSKALDIEYIKSALDRVFSSSSIQNALLFNSTKLTKDTLMLVQGLIHEIAGLVPVIELVNSKFTWSVGQSQSYFPLIQIQDSVYNGEQTLDVEIEAQLIEHYESRNVIGYIPSKKKCAKTILFTAHYDHLGRMGQDVYFPGANDNASGTAMLITLSNYFKEHPSNYNVMFVAFAGEEAGLVGSKYFVDNPILKLKKIEFVINLDIMGSGEESITVVNATLFDKEFEELKRINEERNLVSEIKSRGPAANSDHYWFTEKGVPAFFIYTTGPNKNYHDIFDTYEELSFNEYEDIATLLIEFVNNLSRIP